MDRFSATSFFDNVGLEQTTEEEEIFGMTERALMAEYKHQKNIEKSQELCIFRYQNMEVSQEYPQTLKNVGIFVCADIMQKDEGTDLMFCERNKSKLMERKCFSNISAIQICEEILEEGGTHKIIYMI